MPDLIKINSNISLGSGNIFLSNMETITVTVNCVGIMGKGLALQAKDLFPEVAEYYKNLCEINEMKLGRVFIFNKEADSLKNFNGEFKKILLFPTKDHWKNPSKINEIERGLEWFSENFKKLEIHSLAISALGCGYGKLNWRDVGPIMYKYLDKMKMPVEIYLPKDTPNKFKTMEFLQKEPSKITDF